MNHIFEFGARLRILLQFEQRPAERDARGKIHRVVFKPRAADADGLVVVARPPQLLGEGGERDRRRVFVNPASKLLNAPMSVSHDACESGI
jgi:hypothetical protein